MYREAVEFFYASSHFDFSQTDLGATLAFLRDVIPREGFVRIVKHPVDRQLWAERRPRFYKYFRAGMI